MSNINHDIAMKCGQDVAETIRRNMQLIEDRQGMLMIAVSGAAMATVCAAGAFSAVEGGNQPKSDWVDALWDTMIRPMVMASIGDRTDFLKILERLK